MEPGTICQTALAAEPNRVAAAIGHDFRDPALLLQALTHRSFANEHVSAGPDNERLEFLGDAVLDLAISEMLLAGYATFDEGSLTRVRAEVVNSGRLAELARTLDLGSALRLGRGERRSGGQAKENVLADALEALLGAVFLDGGYGAAARCVQRLFTPLLATAARATAPSDFKSRLQELQQGRGAGLPQYELVATSGPDHAPLYTVAVFLGGEEAARGAGRTKKAAEQDAARLALARLEEEG